MLKLLIAKQRKLDISEINIEIDTNKKPYVALKDIHFNVSHSGDFAIIAIDNAPVGVDIEHQIKDFEFKDLLPNTFSIKEISVILNASDPGKAFYKFWTRKEAIVKTSGIGIDNSLPKIPVLDGRHYVDPNLIDDLQKLYIGSFYLNDDHVASIATNNKRIMIDQVSIFKLPSTLDELKSLFRNC